ncbi:MAG: hypothetical protein N2662_04960 [Bacteroidales bacterium]|nr:hypothetical protein [Bacteroidales bacterium]
MFQSLTFKLYKFSLLLLCFMSMYAWFLWKLNILVIALAFIATIIFILQNKDKVTNSAVMLIPLFLLLIFELYTVRDNEAQAYFSAIIRTFVIGSVLFLNLDSKKQLLNFLTKSIAILLAISMLAWIAFLLGMPLPHHYIEYQQGKYSYENYYLFLYNLNMQEIFLPRYSAIFPEPGNLALITTVFIIANKFNFRKWPVMILFLATLFSFSLAGYVLVTLSLFLYLIIISKHSIRNFIIFSTVIVAFVVFFINFQDGQNPVNLLIFERLKFEDGNIAGYNRTTFIFDEFYKRFTHSLDVILGMGPKAFASIYGAFGKGTAGLKVFIVMHGILGLLFLLALYSTLFFKYPSKLGLIMLVTYMLCFYQNTYPLAEIVIIPYILSLPLFLLPEDKKVWKK